MIELVVNSNKGPVSLPAAKLIKMYRSRTKQDERNTQQKVLSLQAFKDSCLVLDGSYHLIT